VSNINAVAGWKWIRPSRIGMLDVAPMADRTDTADDLPAPHKRVAIKWLMWEHGMTVEEASTAFDGLPHGATIARARREAIDVATFIVEECHGR
jgi:hypothetical protein